MYRYGRTESMTLRSVAAGIAVAFALASGAVADKTHPADRTANTKDKTADYVDKTAIASDKTAAHFDATAVQQAKIAPRDATMDVPPVDMANLNAGDPTLEIPEFTTSATPSVVNGGFEYRLDGWTWEFNIYPGRDGQFVAEGSASAQLAPQTRGFDPPRADDLPGVDRQVELRTSVTASNDTPSIAAGGRTELDLYQFLQVPPDNRSTAVLRRAVAVMTAAAGLHYDVTISQNAEVDVGVELILHNDVTGESLTMNLAGLRFIGPCAGQMSVQDIIPWKQFTEAAAHLDSQPGDWLSIHLRLSTSTSLSGEGSFAHFSTRAMADNINAVLTYVPCQGAIVNLAN